MSTKNLLRIVGPNGEPVGFLDPKSLSTAAGAEPPAEPPADPPREGSGPEPDRVRPPLEFATLAEIQQELARRYDAVILTTFGGPEARSSLPLRFFFSGHEAILSGVLDSTDTVIGSHLAEWNDRLGSAEPAA